MPRKSTDPTALTAVDFAHMQQVTDRIRTEEGLGGQCGWVAEVLFNTHGWAMYGGVYHSADGHPVGDHVWNVHEATGTIIDATADQFGEGAEVRVLPPEHPLYGRYRHAESEEQEEEWLDAARDRDNAEGDYWWVPGGPSNPDVMAYEARVRVWEAS